MNFLPPPHPPSSSQPSASEPGKTGQNSWQAPSKTCCRTGCVWHFQKLLNLSLALSFPALGCHAFKNRHVPSTSTLLLEVQEPQDGFHVPCGPAAVTGLCPGETPPRSCPLHSSWHSSCPHKCQSPTHNPGIPGQAALPQGSGFETLPSRAHQSASPLSCHILWRVESLAKEGTPIDIC